MNLVKLKDSAREIRDNWEEIELLEKKVLDDGNAWIVAMALQGHRLILARSELKVKDWPEWLHANFPAHEKRAERCIKIAQTMPNVESLDAATSLRQALFFFAPEKQANNVPPRVWPAPIEANSRLFKFTEFVGKHPLKDWPEEQREAAREKLLPVVSALWPERF